MIFAIGSSLLIAFIVTACGGSGGQPPAKAGSLLRKIQDRGRLIVGVNYDQPMFGHRNPQTNAIEGFDPAVGREIAAYIFGDPSRIEFKEAQAKDRIPLLKDGTVDVVLATFAINDDRLKDVDFSVVYYVAGQRLLVAKDSPIKSVSDLDANKKVGSVKGSTSADNLRKLVRSQVVEFDTFSQAVQAMLSKQVDAVSADDIILYGLALTNPTTKVVGVQFSYEPYGVGVAKGNPELLDAVNVVIKNLKSSGKWKTIWKTEIGDKLGMTAVPDPPGDDWRK